MNWKVLEIDAISDNVFGREFDEMVDMLEDELQLEGMDYYITSDPYANQIVILIVPESYINSGELDSIFDAIGLTYTIK